MRAIYWSDPRHVDEPLKPWMTPRYVMRSYDLPRDVVLEALKLAPGDEAPRRLGRLGRLAAERGVSLETFTEAIRAAADVHRDMPE